jgi:2-oxoglutarate dehydrogenase E2 component (dihydrolipoamide succinyltransferase)
MSLRKVLLPDLGIDDQPITVSSWLVKRGTRVTEDDPVVEVLCGGATVDLPAGVSGVLMEKTAAEDDVLQVGQALAVIETPDK